MSCQIIMIVCLQSQLTEFDLEFHPNFYVLLVKFPCSIALHLFLHPEIHKGLVIMKYANNQAELFHGFGSQISFMLGFMQMFISIYAQFINIYLLVNQSEVEPCIIFFVAFQVILEFMKLYLESLKDPQLVEILDKHPLVKYKGKDIRKRSCFHYLARFVYKVVRAFYVSVIFYFIPYGVFLMMFIFTLA